MVITEPEWLRLLKGGFAFMTAPFAMHPLDAARARKMVFASIRDRVTTDDLKAAAIQHLETQGCNQDMIEENINRLFRFISTVKPTRTKKSAWLIYWEYMQDDIPEIEERIIAIWDGRKSGEKVREFVEQYYMAQSYSLLEKTHFATHRKDNPYPATFDRNGNGVQWSGVITCGGNPFVIAQYVKKLCVYDDQQNGTAITWENVKPKSLAF